MQITIFALICATTAFSLEAGISAPDFNLVSGDGKTITLKDLKSCLAIILYEDKDHIEDNRILKNELNRIVPLSKSCVRVIPVIDCSSAFWPLTKIWKSNLVKNSEKEKITIYGDWDGSMLRNYGFKPSAANTAVIGVNGNILFFKQEKLNTEDVREISKLITDPPLPKQ